MNSSTVPLRCCRVCLEPEDTEPFKKIFAENGMLALKIYRIAGIYIMDVDKHFPSLICKKCNAEIEAVETLKMRILDADDYFLMMTAFNEKKFLEKDIKLALIDDNKKLQAPTPSPAYKVTSAKKVVSNRKKSNSKKSVSKRTKPKPKVNNNENVKPMKRSFEPELDDISDSEIFKKPKLDGESYFTNATPSKFGIKRMLIKSKSFFKLTGSKRSDHIKPKLAKKRPSRGKNKPTKTITFECDNCLQTFESYPELNAHLETHNNPPPVSPIKMKIVAVEGAVQN